MAKNFSTLLFHFLLEKPIFQTAQSTPGWVPILIGALLLVGFIGLLIWLFTTGKLRQWYQAGTQGGKWKIQDLQLSNEIKKTERLKVTQIEELGKKAWDARVSDPAYQQAWSDLEAIEEQIEVVKVHSRNLQDNLNQVSTQTEEITQNYNNQIETLDNQRKETEQKLKQAQSELKQLETDIDSLANQKTSFQRDIKATRTDLINLEGSEEPDRGEIMANLNARLDSLVQNLLNVSNAEPELASKIPARQSEVLTLNTHVSDLGDQMKKLEYQKEQELEPLKQQIEALKKQIQNKTDEVQELERKMEPKVKALGHMVDTARPGSDVLQESYSKLDSVYRKMSNISQERDSISSKLEELDKTASRNFYLLILLGIIVITLAILLITGVL
jgi:chromosome segregation ATPase